MFRAIGHTSDHLRIQIALQVVQVIHFPQRSLGSCRLVTLRSKRRGKLLSKSLPCHIERNGYESRVPVLQAHLHIMINPGCSVEYLHI